MTAELLLFVGIVVIVRIYYILCGADRADRGTKSAPREDDERG